MTSTFARRAGLVAVGQTVVKLTQLALAIVFVRLLDPDAWNQAALLLSVYLAGVTLGNLNLHHGIVYVLPQTPRGQQRRLVLRTVAALVGVGLVIGAVLVVIAPRAFDELLSGRERMMWIGLAIALELPSVTVGMTLVSLERWRAVAAWDIAGTIAILSATVVPVTLGYGIGGLVVGLTIAGALRLAGGVLATYAVLPAPDAVGARRLLWNLVAYALPLGAALGVSICNRFVDKWFIAVFRPDEFGVYAVAAQEIPVLAVIPYAGGTVLVATLVAAFQRGDRASARDVWLQLTASMSVVVVPLSIALVLLAPELIVLVFGREFVAGVLPFQIFTLVTAHRVAEYGMLLRAAGRTRALLHVAGVTLLTNTVLAGFGARFAGMTGASLGTLVASAIGWGWALRWIADTLGVGIGQAFAWRTWTTTMAAAGLAAIVAQVGADIVTDATSTGIGGRAVVKLSIYLALAGAAIPVTRRRPAPTHDGERAARPPAELRTLERTP